MRVLKKEHMRERIKKPLAQKIADLRLKDGIDVVVAVSASEKRVGELNTQQEQLKLEREGLTFTGGDTKEFQRRQQKLDAQCEKLKTDNELVKQYAAIRHSIKVKDNPTYPTGPTLVGDDEASFLLAVKDGKVLGGFRLNEIPAGAVLDPEFLAQYKTERIDRKRTAFTYR